MNALHFFFLLHLAHFIFTLLFVTFLFSHSWVSSRLFFWLWRYYVYVKLINASQNFMNCVRLLCCVSTPHGVFQFIFNGNALVFKAINSQLTYERVFGAPRIVDMNGINKWRASQIEKSHDKASTICWIFSHTLSPETAAEYRRIQNWIACLTAETTQKIHFGADVLPSCCVIIWKMNLFQYFFDSIGLVDIHSDWEGGKFLSVKN